MLHLFNVFRENDGKENCAQVLEEEVNKMFGTKSLNDEHDCNVVSMNSLNIHNTNDDCTSHDKKISYKHVNFCGVHRVCEDMPKREDRFCKRHKYLETKWLQERLDVCAERLIFLLAILVNFAMKVVILISNVNYFMIELCPKIVITSLPLSIIMNLVYFWGMKK